MPTWRCSSPAGPTSWKRAASPSKGPPEISCRTTTASKHIWADRGNARPDEFAERSIERGKRNVRGRPACAERSVPGRANRGKRSVRGRGECAERSVRGRGECGGHVWAPADEERLARYGRQVLRSFRQA